MRDFTKTALRSVALIGAFFVLVAPASAAFPDASAALFSSSGDSVGGGIPRLYTEENATITVTGTARAFTVHVSGGDLHSFNLGFGARQGSELKPGTYKDPVRSSAQSPNKPVMYIDGDGNGCNSITGSFEVRDIEVDATGAVDKLELLFEQHCDGARPALFGELRVAEPTPAGAAAAVTPSALRFPATTFGEPAATAAVALLVTRPMSLTTSAITGPDASAFSETVMTCSGVCPNPAGPFGYGDVAGVRVTYAPPKPEKSSAMLRLLDSDGHEYGVPLRGTAER